MNAGPLQGRTAVVTGSTSGIGLGIAHAMAKAGANLMLNGLGVPEEIETDTRKPRLERPDAHPLDHAPGGPMGATITAGRATPRDAAAASRVLHGIYALLSMP